MDLVSVQDWSNAKQESTDDSNHLRAIDGVVMLLNDEISPASAAKIITEAYDSYVKDPETRRAERSNKVTDFWALYMCDAIRMFGSACECLIELHHEITKQPDVQCTDGLLAKNFYGSVYWRDLPGWSWVCCDHALHYGDPQDYALDEADDYFAPAPELLNGCRFAASLFEQDLNLSPLDLSTQADLFMQYGIENAYNHNGEIKSREWKVILPASAIWLLIAGSTIYKICLEEEASKTNSTPGRRRIWSKEMWDFWKAQLERHANREDIDDECCGFAAQAARAMVLVELDHRGELPYLR